MKTTFDTVDIVFADINSSSLKTEITGGVYKRRPAGSTKEDIVVNALPITNQQLQQNIVNVNIHAPNKPITVNGVQDISQPDTVRLKQLARIAVDLLHEKWGPDYNYSIQQQHLFFDEEYNDHYINIRIEFYIENL